MTDTSAINRRVVALGAALSHTDVAAAQVLLSEIGSRRAAILHVVAALEVANSVIRQHGGEPAEVLAAVALNLAVDPED